MLPTFCIASAPTRNGYIECCFRAVGRVTEALRRLEIGETVEDAAKVMSRYAAGLGIRILEDKVPYYGAGDELIREYAQWCSIPVISMAHDKYHPCQGLADVLTVKEKFGGFKGVKFVMSWAYSPSIHKPRAVPQSTRWTSSDSVRSPASS